MALTLALASVNLGAIYPADTTLSYVETPVVAMPDFRRPLTDPTWGTKVRRVTYLTGFGHNYSKRTPWSPTEAYFLVYNTVSGERMILDGTSFDIIRTTSAINSGSIWPNTAANEGKVLTTGSAPKSTLSWRDVLTDALTTIHVFTGYTTLEIGDGEGNIDDNDRYIVLQGLVSGNETVVVYDIIADSVIATKTFTTRPDNASISHSGLYVTVLFPSANGQGAGAEQGLWLFDRTLGTAIRQLNDLGGAHGDHAYDTAGNEVWANTPNGGAAAYMHRLSDGVNVQILPANTAFRRGHMSGRAIDRPGWALGSDYAPPDNGTRVGTDQIVWIKLNEVWSGTETVQVLAHAHHGADVAVNDPFAAPNRDGTKVAFRSEWDATDQYEYVASEA